MDTTTLPHGITFRNFGGDLLIEGRGLSRERYLEILETLSDEVKGRVIGWRSVGSRGQGAGVPSISA